MVTSDAEEKLLKQIREDFRYAKEYWRENHEESEKDMDCMACIPPSDFKDDRKGRPCIWPDETSQYVKQANNNLRQNKRSIKVSPRSLDANAKDAEHRQAYIRGIEYASRAQSIYSRGYEACTESAFGVWRVTTKVTGPKGEQEPRIGPIPNQFTVYFDPDALESDFSDGTFCFVLDRMREKTFAKRYPKAKKTSFTKTDIETAPDWFSGDHVVVSEYWTREEVEHDGEEKKYKVTQYITNGVEILETNPWIGSWIPIIGVFGEELYIRNGGQSKRMFLSMIRRARSAQQMMAYIASQEAEEFGMAPRAPYLVLKGTVNGDQWKLANKVPTAYLEWGVPQNWNTAWGPPPAPTRQPFIPNAQAYEVAYERWRRSHQAAMGVSPLPTSAQRQNEKSGVALERIQTQEAVGTYHFTDNFLRSLGNTGRQVNELITLLAELDSLPAQLLGRDQKDEDVQIKVAPRTQNRDPDSEHLDEADQFFAHQGQYEVSISDGPNYQSQMEEASDFADTLVGNLPKLGLPPALTQAVLAIAVKLKNIGAMGDEIHDLLAPPDPNNIPPQAKAILAQAQGHIQQLTQELQQLQMEKMGKVVEQKGKMEIATMQEAVKMTEADKDRETKIAVAEITTKAQSISERMGALEDLMKQFHSQAHELALAVQTHGQAKELAQQNAEAQSVQAEQQGQIQSEQADQQAKNDQANSQGENQ